jgi:predicted MFS family arabinose efflux permease
MEKLSINKLQYGILGSFVFGGLTLGSIVSTGLYSKGNLIKPTLIGSLILTALTLLLFTVSTSFYFLLFLRGATGFFQIFLIVYQPVWTDTFCEEKFKSIALTVNMLASPLGIVGGYMLTYAMNK